jgi:hypothetical protein
MTDRPEVPDTDAVQALWQGQEQESPTMTLQAIRMLVRNDRDHVRNGLLFGLVLIVVEAFAFGRFALTAKNDVMRAGELVVLVGLGWMAWRMWRRASADRRLPDAAATTQTLIAFHRAQLARRRVGYGWMMVTVAPLFVGIAVAAYGGWLLKRGPLANLVPIVALSALWFVAAWFMQRRQARKLQEQIDELDQMARR